MHARPVGQPGVEHRPLFVDLAAHVLGHVVDRRQQGVFAGEPGVGVFELPAAFDVDVVDARSP